MDTARKQAPRPARPAARYWKGKAPKGAADVESDSEEENVRQEVPEEGDVLLEGDQDFGDEDEEEAEDIPLRAEARVNAKSMNVTLRDVNISKDGKVIVAGREESGRTEIEQEESEEEEEEEEEATVVRGAESESEEESSEYETGSEEEEVKPQFRPVFVPKRSRATIAEREALAQDTQDALNKKEQEAEERRKQSHDLVAESIRRELAEKEKEEEVIEIDDTDGLDPEAEFEAWRLRELARIKNEKEEEMQRELEREEVERRRAMPEEQRLKEDLENAQKSRDEKPKGQQKFLQKYWHKGAFHQDEEILKKRDYTEATESTLDISLLPKVMQVRNFGKRSRTKYTHLLDQDTTVSGGLGGTAPVKVGGNSTGAGGCFNCGGPHLKKDCPNITGPLTERGGTGANSVSTGPRRWGDRAEGGSCRDRDDKPGNRNGGWKTDRDDDSGRRRDDRYRDRESRDYGRRDYYDKRSVRRRSRSFSRSRSPRRRSRSPRYSKHDGHRTERHRSRERSLEDYREKRRRLA